MADQEAIPAKNRDGVSSTHKPVREFTKGTPELKLPSSSGSIRGIGEKFNVSPATGSGTISVPIAMSEIRGAPHLALSYDSGAGNGPFGLGWSLGLPAIARKTEKRLPEYTAEDVFTMAGLEDLVPVKEEVAGVWQVTTYMQRTEGSFSWIRRFTGQGGDWWLVIDRTNVRRWFGAYPDEAGEVSNSDSLLIVRDPNRESDIFTWLLAEERDDRGNRTVYNYVSEDNANISPSDCWESNRSPVQPNRYVKRIDYGLLPKVGSAAPQWFASLIFDYGEHTGSDPSHSVGTWNYRDDAFSSYRSGFDIRTRRRCERILQFQLIPESGRTDQVLNASTEFSYDDASGVTQLTEVQHLRHEWNDGTYQSETLPAAQFGYANPTANDRIASIWSDQVVGTPSGLNGEYRFIDLDGEALSGILTEQGGDWHYRRNQGAGQFDPPRALKRPAGFASLASGAQIAALENDGQPYFYGYGETGGFAERLAPDQWDEFVAFPNQPNIDWSAKNIRWLDLNGDGLPELVILNDEIVDWYRNEGKDGIQSLRSVPTGKDQNVGPARIFQDGLETIFTADMCGDGLTDIVRIRNGDVSYWPNLGYGRFGPRVDMGSSPVFAKNDTFDPGLMQLGDIDGSGTTDLLYLDGRNTRYWVNRSGNRWSEAFALPQMPPTDQLTDVGMVDLLGNGTSCLVWSSRSAADQQSPWRYVELMVDHNLAQADVKSVPAGILSAHGLIAGLDGRADLTGLNAAPINALEAAGAVTRMPCKPYLLREIDNGMGAITRLDYKPSTHFYLNDRAKGSPWITKLPFCVHVLDRQEIIDLVTGQHFVSRYSYHHGYYDRAEREFRGFGRVDQWDMESDVQIADQTPTPILTKSWFHTGAYIEASRISSQFSAEYYEVPTGHSLQDSVIEDQELLSIAELRQAKRALRGQPLRSETYSCLPFVSGQDKPTPAGPPHVVQENRFRVRKWHESRLRGEFSIFHSIAEESLTFACEEDENDARLAHQMTLASDLFGTPTLQAQIAYGRAGGGSAVHPEQKLSHVVITQTAVAKKARQPMGWHRIAIPLHSRTWELGHSIDVNAAKLPRPDQILTLFQSGPAPVTSKSSPLAPGERRLISAQVQLYRANTDLDLNAQPLDLGQVGSMALGARSYMLAFSPTDVGECDGQFSADDFWAAKYLDPLDPVASPEHQTLPQFRQFIESLPDTRPLDGRIHAGWWVRDNETELSAQYFYAPTAERDAWGNITTIELDPFALMPVKATNALGHVTAAEIDYRLLAPKRVIDANGATQSARFDILGHPVQTAVTGAHGEGDQLGALAVFDPASTATSWMAYQFYQGPSQPGYVHSWARETHHSDLAGGQTSRWLESRVYTDGFGREVLSKAKNPPGDYHFDAKGKPGNSGSAPRWTGSGRTEFNAKGKPVRQFEPYFAADVDYGDGAQQHGVSPLLHYDPLDRVVKTDFPDGTTNRVAFDPWEQASYDALDEFDPVKAPGYDPVEPGHLGTPQKQFLDSLARPCRTEVTNFDPVSGTTSTYISRVEYDIVGNPLRTYDAKGQLALQQWFDRAGRPFKAVSNDAGTSYALDGLDGQPFIVITANGHRIEQRYDELRRPTETWVTEAGGAPYLREAIIYADNQPTIPYGKGKPWRVFDPVGMVETTGYDFKGVPLTTSRHVLGSLMNATSPPPDFTDWSQHDLTAALSLFSESHATATRINALGKPVESTGPDGSVQRFSYDDGGAVNGIVLDKLPGASGAQAIVDAIDYDAQGRRARIAYGNGTVTTYGYDPLTLRLTGLRTTRGGDVLQDLDYRYDPLGNIVRIIDLAQDAVILNNQSVAPVRYYAYDSISRLVRADGREHIGQTQPDQRFRPDGLTPANANDIAGLRPCREEWLFDAIGNITRWQHSGPDAGQNWARDYAYASPSNNRLTETSVTIGGNTQTTPYTYDDAGNVQAFAHLTKSRWNCDNQPEMMLLHGNVTALYRYDAGGERAVKRIEKPGGQVEIRLYLGGFEIYREFAANGALKLRRDSLHLIDGTSRILMIETEKTGDDILAAQVPVPRWQIGDHLGSSALELDSAGQVISYEEYHAYGTSSWHWASTSISQKRYRYTGMERDEESGLQYHSARYYLPWLGRWLSCDPLGMVDGACLWAYVRGNPMGLSDQGGEQATVDDDLNSALSAVKNASGTFSSILSAANKGKFNINIMSGKTSVDNALGQTNLSRTSEGKMSINVIIDISKIKSAAGDRIDGYITEHSLLKTTLIHEVAIHVDEILSTYKDVTDLESYNAATMIHNAINAGDTGSAPHQDAVKLGSKFSVVMKDVFIRSKTYFDINKTYFRGVSAFSTRLIAPDGKEVEVYAAHKQYADTLFNLFAYNAKEISLKLNSEKNTFLNAWQFHNRQYDDTTSIKDSLHHRTRVNFVELERSGTKNAISKSNYNYIKDYYNSVGGDKNSKNKYLSLFPGISPPRPFYKQNSSIYKK